MAAFSPPSLVIIIVHRLIILTTTTAVGADNGRLLRFPNNWTRPKGGVCTWFPQCGHVGVSTSPASYFHWPGHSPPAALLNSVLCTWFSFVLDLLSCTFSSISVFIEVRCVFLFLLASELLPTQFWNCWEFIERLYSCCVLTRLLLGLILYSAYEHN